MTTKHTPGPWEFTGKYLVTQTDNTLLSIKPESAEGGAHFEANARLIAAAPDLLAALENFPVGPWPLLDQFIWNETVRLPALAKAEGKAVDTAQEKLWSGDVGARLSVAAPELLAALQAFVNDTATRKPEADILEQAHKAITKATDQENRK
jgi:hypothetical protein